MGTKSLLVVALAAASAVTFLNREAPGVPRSARTTEAADLPFELRAEGPPESLPRPRVVGTDGAVAGASLAFHPWRAAEPVCAAETDGAGGFDLPVGDFWAIVVRAEGYPPKMFPFDRDSMELRLDPGSTRRLAIVDEEGNPGAHADIEVYGDYGLSLLLSSTRADERGVATLWLGGEETILVRLAGYAYERVRDGEQVLLRPGFSIAGRVVDTAGIPVPGASVRAGQGGG